METKYTFDIRDIISVSCEGIGIEFDCMVEKIEDGKIELCGAYSDLPVIEGGGIVRLRYNNRSYMGTMISSSRIKWIIGDIKIWNDREHREFFRQRLDSSVTVTHLDKQGKMEFSLEGKMIDISAVGLRFSCAERDWFIGDKISVDWKKGVPMGGVFHFDCEIVRADKNLIGNFYGCKFIDISEREQERLLKVIFNLQQLERKRLNR